MTRIELAQSAWKAEVRPLHFIGISLYLERDTGFEPVWMDLQSIASPLGQSRIVYYID